jgi:hypothetical protein
MTHVVEHLPRKHEVLTSNPSTVRKKSLSLYRKYSEVLLLHFQETQANPIDGQR